MSILTPEAVLPPQVLDAMQTPDALMENAAVVKLGGKLAPSVEQLISEHFDVLKEAKESSRKLKNNNEELGFSATTLLVDKDMVDLEPAKQKNIGTETVRVYFVNGQRRMDIEVRDSENELFSRRHTEFDLLDHFTRFEYFQKGVLQRAVDRTGEQYIIREGFTYGQDCPERHEVINHDGSRTVMVNSYMVTHGKPHVRGYRYEDYPAPGKDSREGVEAEPDHQVSGLFTRNALGLPTELHVEEYHHGTGNTVTRDVTFEHKNEDDPENMKVILNKHERYEKVSADGLSRKLEKESYVIEETDAKGRHIRQYWHDFHPVEKNGAVVMKAEPSNEVQRDYSDKSKFQEVELQDGAVVSFEKIEYSPLSPEESYIPDKRTLNIRNPGDDHYTAYEFKKPFWWDMDFKPNENMHETDQWKLISDPLKINVSESPLDPLYPPYQDPPAAKAQ